METNTATAKQTYPPSQQQQAVLHWTMFGKGNLNLVARAGCGKTTTLEMVAASLVKHSLRGTWDQAFIGAFNKSIAVEISSRISAAGINAKVKCGTWHSAGISAWRKIAGDVKVDGSKVKTIFNKLHPSTTIQDREIPHPDAKYRDFVVDAVSKGKQRAFGVLADIDDRKAWFDMVDHFGLDEALEDEDGNAFGTVDYGISLAIKVYRASLEACRETVDYDDMILAPLYFKAKVWQYKWVMIDEAQDTNPARRALAKAMVSPYGGRLIAVGDPAQAIYGFTGADADAMDLIKAEMNSATLPLNCTYRCGKEIVALAQTWVPDIQAAPSNAPGTHRRLEDARYLVAEGLGPKDAILCRNTAPLVDLAYQLLAAGIGCQIEGRDIAQGLLKLVDRFSVKTLEGFINKLATYKDKETQKYLAKGKEELAAALADRVETLQVLAEALQAQGKKEVADLKAWVNKMFGNTEPEIRDGMNQAEIAKAIEAAKPKVVTLSTVHKSKGREWNRVFILGRNRYMPSRWARKPWQKEQEENLMYVAVTRAKSELVDIWVEPPKKERT